MKIKLSWIPFIPAALAMVALRLLSVFGNDDTGTMSGMNALLFSVHATLCIAHPFLAHHRRFKETLG